MRLNVALTACVLALALTGSTAIGQGQGGPTSVFLPAPQGAPSLVSRDRRSLLHATARGRLRRAPRACGAG